MAAPASEWADIPCPACDGAVVDELLIGRDEFFGFEGTFRLVRCRACDLVFISPRPPWERILQHYPAAYYSFVDNPDLPSVAAARNWVQRVRLRDLGYAKPQPGMLARFITRLYELVRAEQLRAAFRPVPQWQQGGRLLDVGCGSGSYLAQMVRLGWRAVGIDVSERACATAAAAGLQVHCGMIRDVPLAEQSFDVVTIWETLEHVPDPRPTLERIRALISPGGRLLGSVPNIDTLYLRWFGPAYLHLDLPRHLLHFSRRSLRGLLERSGFRRIRIRTHTHAGDAWLCSRALRENRRRGRLGLPHDFWERQGGRLRLTTWALKPLHLALDACGRGLQLEFEAWV